MTPDEFLDFALGQIDDGRHPHIKYRLVSDPQMADRAQTLKSNLARLLDDGQEIEPPPGLARRTILHVEARRQRKRLLDYAPVRTPFRWADVAVAAGVFLAGILTLAPAVHRSHTSARLAGCADNLRQIGLGLYNYANSHQEFPHVGPDSPVGYSGAIASILSDVGVLDNMSAWDCPGDGRDPLPQKAPPVAELTRLISSGNTTPPSLLHNDYAMHMGYFDRDQWHPLRMSDSTYAPLVADHPPFCDHGQAVEGNSPNHARRGQNVLFGDISVRFRPIRTLGPDPDIFLNRYGHTAPGVGPEDHVLGSALAPVPHVP